MAKPSRDPVVEKAPVAEVPEDKPAHEYKSFSVLRKSGNWVMVTTTIGVYPDGNAKVIKVESTEPNLKPLALEAFKIAAFKWWTSQ